MIFSIIWVKKRLNVSKTMAKNVLKDPGRALKFRANISAALASRNSKAALLSLPEVIDFYHSVKGLYLGKLV